LKAFAGTRLVLLGTGVLLGAVSLAVYGRDGYSRGMLLVWLAGLVTLGLYFWKESSALPRLALRDVVAAGALVALFAPLYVAHLYDWPVQVISDEPTIMDVSQQYSSSAGVDPFGVTDFQIRPALLFVFWGHAGKLLGGIDLAHMRLLHALIGLIAIGASYALFRQLLPRPWAFFAGCLFGFNHAYLLISRLAMRENTAVLAEVVALALLLRGLRHGHVFSTYVGGIVAGIGFYTYHPGRAAILLWLLFLLLLGLLYRSRFPLRRIGRFGAIACAGFVMMAGPLLIAESKAPPVAREVDPMAQLLITSKGRELQRDWVSADSVWAGYRKNVEFGLTTFNNKVVDHGWIYVNPGHGFVDPLTGILVWIGVAAVGFLYVRRRRQNEPWPLLMLSSFLALWIAYAFLINQAPKYPRLLIILPFVAYLVTEAVRLLGRNLERGLSRLGRRPSRLPSVGLAAVAVAVIATWNLAIAWDFVDRGRKEGEPIGSTGRYIASHPSEDVYLVADQSGPYPYFTWGYEGWWHLWLARFSPEVRLREIVTSNELRSLRPQPPFALLMSRQFLYAAERDLVLRYPHGRVRNILPGGRLVVFEVRGENTVRG
jgi:4-amino-4-deoxy-L-arabinose transferase-like glycosyltransferase